MREWKYRLLLAIVVLIIFHLSSSPGAGAAAGVINKFNKNAKWKWWKKWMKSPFKLRQPHYNKPDRQDLNIPPEAYMTAVRQSSITPSAKE